MRWYVVTTHILVLNYWFLWTSGKSKTFQGTRMSSGVLPQEVKWFADYSVWKPVQLYGKKMGLNYFMCVHVIETNILKHTITHTVIPYLIFLIPGPPGGGLRFLSISLRVPAEMNQPIRHNLSQNKVTCSDGRNTSQRTNFPNSLHLAGTQEIRLLKSYVILTD